MISSSMNLVMTVLGFAVSATFIVFVCARLLCVRAVRRRRRRQAAAPGFEIERSLSGLEPSVVATFPTVKYNQRIFSSREDALCTVCLNDYAEKEILRLLPWCGHAFHIDCIDVWLRQHSTCPICRLSLRDSPDRRLLNYSQMNPALRSQLRLSNEVENQPQQQEQQQQQQQQPEWSSQVFAYGETENHQDREHRLVSLWPGKWSLKLWRRSDRDDDEGGSGATHVRAPVSQDSSVTININIGQMPPPEVSGAANQEMDATSTNSSSNRSLSRENDGRDDGTEQREVSLDSNHHSSRPVNLSIELNVCDNGIFGYSTARS